MPGEYRIEAVTAETFPAWRMLRLRALRDHPDAFGQPYAQYAAVPPEAALAQFLARQEGGLSRTFGAFVEEELAGTIGIFREERPKETHRMTIVAMYVAPEARGCGIADALMRAALDHARSTPGVLQVHLAVTSHNVAARKLYERHGFVRYGTDPRALLVDGTPYDEDLMVCMLDDYPLVASRT